MNQLWNFTDAAEVKDGNERGISAFATSQIMDIDTQTNFNIIDYESKSRSINEQYSLEESLETMTRPEIGCTCKS